MGTDIRYDITALVEQARLGNTNAFERIVRQYQSLISGILYSMTGDFHRSEDLAQETFLIAWNKLGELKNTEDLAPWLCTIARNLAHRSSRKKTDATTDSPEIFDEKASAEPEPDREMQRQEQSELLWSAIGEIPEAYRETLVLYYRSGQSAKEIAAATGSSVDAVNQRLVRARKSLKSKLEEIVGEILTETAPGEAFTFSVMTAITAGAIVSSAQTALAASGTAAATGTAATTTGKVVGFASFWAVLGPLALVVWYISFFWCMFYLSIRNLPTLPSRRFRTYNFFWGLQYFFVLCCSLGPIMGILILTGTNSPMLFMLLTFIIPMPIALYYHLRNMKTLKKILKNDLGLTSEPVKSYSFEQVERQFHRAIFTNFLVLETFIAYISVLAVFEGIDAIAVAAFWTAQLVLVLTMVSAYLLGRHLVELCRSPESLLENPPIVSNPFEIVLNTGKVYPGSMDLPKKAKKTFFVMVFGWTCYAIAASVFLYHFLDWSWRSGEKILTLGLIAASLLGYTILGSLFIKTRSQFRICTFVFFFFSAWLLLYLGTLEPDSLSLGELFRNAFQGDFSWGVVQKTSIGAALPILFMSFLHLLFWFYESPKTPLKSVEKRNETPEFDDVTREAIAAFELKTRPGTAGVPPAPASVYCWAGVSPASKHEENTMQTVPCRTLAGETPAVPGAHKAFPRRWFWICVSYGILVCVLFFVGGIIPSPISHKNTLRRNGDFTAQIALEPDNPEWYFQRGARESDPEKAVTDLDKALRLRPDDAKIYHARARAYNNWGSQVNRSLPELSEDAKYYYHRATADCDEAIRLEPDWLDSWSQRAGIHIALHEKEAAIADYDKAIALMKQRKHERYYYPFYLYRGELYQDLGEHKKALADYSEMLRFEKRFGNGSLLPHLQQKIEELKKAIQSQSTTTQ